MNINRLNVAVRMLIAVFLVVLPLVGCFVSYPFQSPVEAQAGSKTPPPASSRKLASKLSIDLQEQLVQSAKSAQMAASLVSVIVQTEAAPSSSLLSSLRGLGGVVSKGYVNVDALAMKIPYRSLNTLAAKNDVRYISLDRPTQLSGVGHVELTTGTDQARFYGTGQTGTINGSGVGIAVLDSGIYAGHASITASRVVASVDFTGEGRTDDPYGHGTHVASLAASNSTISSGAYTGVAPAANLINVRVLNSQGTGSSSAVISGIDWCISNKALYNIKVMNISLGTTAVDSYVYDPICQAVRRAFNAGIVVCVAAGNFGKDMNGAKVYGGIHSPGIEPSAITVGAANTFGTNSRGDDKLATYSSRGPTRGYYTDVAGVRHYDNLIKPDLVAPGNKLIAAKSPNNRLVLDNPLLNVTTGGVLDPTRGMMRLSGTSMSTPVVAGTVALLLQRNPTLTPNMVKAALEYTAQPVAGFDNLEQGAGLLNIEGAVRLAGLIRQDLGPSPALGTQLLVSIPTQSTTIASGTFSWSGGLIQRWNVISGQNLVTKFQGIYHSSGVLLSDGVMCTDGVMTTDGVLLSDGVMSSDGVLLSDGTILSSGTLAVTGVLLSDGVLLADGVMIVDGVLLSDSVLQGTAAATYAMSVPANGDLGTEMEGVPDVVP